MGFPRRKRVIDRYARCLLCRADLSIAGRGLSSLWDHWMGVEHTRLEQKYRIMTQRPLLDKSCRAVTAEEDRRIRRERMSEPPVFMETELSLTVEERIAIEEEEELEGQRPHLPEGSADYLWLCNFIVAFTNSTSFGGFMRLVDAWSACTSTELRFECRVLNYSRCQVCIMSFFCVIGLMCVCCVCVCSGVIVLCFVVFDVVIVLQSLVLYGLYPYVLDQLDATLEVSSCAGVSIHHCHGQWRGECHVVSSLQVKTLVLSVVAESSEWEKHLVENVVPVLACLKNGAGIKVVSVEGEVLVGKAIAASLASDTPLVVGMVTARTVFEEIRRQFLVEFSGLDPLSILE